MKTEFINVQGIYLRSGNFKSSPNVALYQKVHNSE